MELCMNRTKATLQWRAAVRNSQRFRAGNGASISTWTTTASCHLPATPTLATTYHCRRDLRLGTIRHNPLRSCALTRHDALASCEPMCRSLCTGCSCRWRAWLCVRDTRRTSRSSCCATRSQSCADRTIVQLSPMRTGRCWVPSLRPRPDGCEPVGSPHQSHRATAANCPNDTLPRPHQRIPNSCLTSHDTISDTHRAPHVRLCRCRLCRKYA